MDQCDDSKVLRSHGWSIFTPPPDSRNIAYEPSTVHTQFNFPPLDVSNAFLNEAFIEDAHMEPSKNLMIVHDQHTSVQKFIGRVEYKRLRAIYIIT